MLGIILIIIFLLLWPFIVLTATYFMTPENNCMKVFLKQKNDNIGVWGYFKSPKEYHIEPISTADLLRNDFIRLGYIDKDCNVYNEKGTISEITIAKMQCMIYGFLIDFS